MARAIACHQARQALQRFLDQRHARPIPAALKAHLAACEPCAAWQALLDYEPREIHPPLSKDFSRRVVAAYLQPMARPQPKKAPAMHWLAAAAVLIAACSIWMLPKSPPGSPPQNLAWDERVAELMPVMNSVRQEFEHFPQRVQRWQPGSEDLLAALPLLKINWPTEPLSDSLPSFKSIGETLQGAVEPLETPAREAYQKVKMLMDDAAVRKFWQSISRGAV